MAKNVRKTTESIYVIIVILSIIGLGYVTYRNYLSYEKESKKTITLKKDLDEVTEKYNEKIKEQDELVANIKKLENISATISKMKEDVFSLASTVEKRIQNKETNYKIAYITFDDGPYHLTDKVIEILKEKKVKATFFTIGLNKDTCFDNRNYSCKETYKKIVDNGHTIANHTYSHQIFNGLYSSANSFMDQVKKQENMIKERTGVTTNIIRFPGGSSTAGALCGTNCKNNIINQLKENGYGWVDWTAQDGDGGSLTDYNTGWRNLTGSINQDIEVILFHDYNQVTASILPNAIDYLEKKDYIILPLFHDSVMVNK